jgi:hypothetical protein
MMIFVVVVILIIIMMSTYVDEIDQCQAISFGKLHNHNFNKKKSKVALNLVLVLNKKHLYLNPLQNHISLYYLPILGSRFHQS